jgi:O-antigen/teichoic acid export membrane protein
MADGAAGTADTLTTAETDLLKRRARRGVVTLVARGAAVQIAHLGGTVALARLLRPEDFGIFAIVQFVVAFFAFFGEAGLGAALIQQHEVPSQRRLSSVFLLQLLASLVIVLVVSASAGLVTRVWPSLPPASPWLLRAMAVSLLLTGIRVIPSILMEREMLFGRLSLIEVVQLLAYYSVAVALAWSGAGVWALAAAVLVQSLAGALGCFLARPWRPDAVLDFSEIRSIIRFGLTYQVKHVVGFVNGAVVPAYAGITLGSRAVGFIEWAQGTAFFPLKLVDVMTRITFPLFSRIHQDRELFARTLERVMLLCGLGTFFMVGLFLGLGRNITHVIFSDQWMPAVTLLYIYALAIGIGFLSPLVAAALDAMGRASVFASLVLGWTAINWIAVPIATRWGQAGFAAGYSVHIVVGNIACLVVMHRLVPEARLWQRLWVAVVGCAVTAAVGATWLHPVSPLGLGGCIVLLLALFAGVVTVLDRTALKDAAAVIPH